MLSSEAGYHILVPEQFLSFGRKQPSSFTVDDSSRTTGGLRQSCNVAVPRKVCWHQLSCELVQVPVRHADGRLRGAADLRDVAGRGVQARLRGRTLEVT